MMIRYGSPEPEFTAVSDDRSGLEHNADSRFFETVRFVATMRVYISEERDQSPDVTMDVTGKAYSSKS